MGEFGWANGNLNEAAYRANFEVPRIPIRFAIIYRFLGYGVMWKGLTPQWHEAATGYMFSLYDTMINNYWAYQWYDDYDDPDMWEKRANAWLWYNSAMHLANTDQMWCGLIGGQAVGPYGDVCESDGIVAVSSMYWPGYTGYGTVVGLGHMEETSHPTSMAAVETALRVIGLQ